MLCSKQKQKTCWVTQGLGAMCADMRTHVAGTQACMLDASLPPSCQFGRTCNSQTTLSRLLRGKGQCPTYPTMHKLC